MKTWLSIRVENGEVKATGHVSREVKGPKGVETKVETTYIELPRVVVDQLKEKLQVLTGAAKVAHGSDA
jgi:hypothetical protein